MDHKFKLEPQTLIILTTNQCTAKCSHCCMNASTERRERLDVAAILKAIVEFKQQFGIHTVVFAGGEPTLMKGALLTALSKCRELGIGTRMVTNASWAVTPEKAHTILQSLNKAGLNELNISCDDYHLPFIPFERVKIAFRAARKLPFSAVIIANASHHGSTITPEYIRAELGEDLPLRFDDTGKDITAEFGRNGRGMTVGISNANLQRLGRGYDSFETADTKTSPAEAVLNQPCPNAVRSAALSPEGTVVACCGFELTKNPVLDFGSIRTQSAKTLIDRANDNLLVKAIGMFGPGFLVKFARMLRPGIIPDKDYVGICEACQDVVTNKDVLDVLFENRVRLAALIEHSEETIRASIAQQQDTLEHA